MTSVKVSLYHLYIPLFCPNDAYGTSTCGHNSEDQTRGHQRHRAAGALQRAALDAEQFVEAVIYDAVFQSCNPYEIIIDRAASSHQVATRPLPFLPDTKLPLVLVSTLSYTGRL
jgi:hypothetical protein